MSQRGIASREVGRLLDEEKKDVKLSNVHMLTTYELRQEMKKRGKFLDGCEGQVNYEILLQELVCHLKREADEKNSCHIQHLYETERRNLKERLQKEKERRRTDAVERSLSRQKNSNYFAEKKSTNEKLFSEKDSTPAETQSEVGNTEKENHLDNVQNTNNIQNINEQISTDNPFRRFRRFKIGGKFA